MAKIFDIYKKQGGIKLLKDYWRAGVLFYTIGQILLTGFNKKSLELLRHGTYLKVNKRLKKKYSNLLKQLSVSINIDSSKCPHSHIVWVCWMQGIDNAPALVQRCYRSLQENLKDRKIVLITSDNLKEYTDFPDYILEKYNKGLITHTHFSDLLRIELLCKHGGTWIDATVFCSGGNIPSYILDSDLFMFQNLKPGADGSTLNVSSWFMTSCSNNKILLAVRELLWEYWKKNNRLIDYFLLHHFIMIVSEYYKDEWNKMVQFPNSFPHVLLLMMFEDFNQEKWDAVTESCPFHKLAYKRSEEDMAKTGTYFNHIMNSKSII